MTLSNQSKGAKSIIRQTPKDLVTKEPRTIQSSELINQIAENTHLSHTDALSAFAMVINSIKSHLIQGDNVNLGDLGILSSCTNVDSNNVSKEVIISFSASKHLKMELLEMAKIHKHISICSQF